MLAKPVIEILTAGHMESSKNDKSSRGLKNFDFGTGVGLGIVAALEKSGGGRRNTLFGRNLTRSNPIPVNMPKNNWRNKKEETEMESMEEYTIVTCHGPDKKSYTKVYSDAVVDGGRKGDDRSPFRIKGNRGSVFHISPVTETTGVPATDFLSSCSLCRKKLHGKDIYMYRGEKAYCSAECRHRQITMDERTEKCSSQASRPAAEAAGSPYANGQMFTAGILAI